MLYTTVDFLKSIFSVVGQRALGPNKEKFYKWKCSHCLFCGCPTPDIRVLSTPHIRVLSTPHIRVLCVIPGGTGCSSAVVVDCGRGQAQSPRCAVCGAQPGQGLSHCVRRRCLRDRMCPGSQQARRQGMSLTSCVRYNFALFVIMVNPTLSFDYCVIYFRNRIHHTNKHNQQM